MSHDQTWIPCLSLTSHQDGKVSLGSINPPDLDNIRIEPET
jgi:hypothetical protein